MTTTIKLLDTLKGRGLPSDYAISKALGRTRSNVSRWRNGHDQMDAEAAAKAAELAGVDPAVTLAQIEAERAQSPKAKTLFEQLHDAAELVDTIKRSPALRAQLDRQFREFAETLESQEEKDKFLSIAKSVCILCQIATPKRHDVCIQSKLRQFPDRRTPKPKN